MLEAIIYGGISGLSLILGAILGLILKLRRQTVAAFMAFGAGVLLCALTIGLMEEAFQTGGFDAVVIGFLLGGVVFVIGDYFIHISGGRKHKKNVHHIGNAESNGVAITFGAVLDGLPESIALGIAIFSGGELGILMLVAIALSNLPEGISSAGDLIKEGFKRSKIILIWLIVAFLTLLVTCVSYKFLHDLNPNTVGILQSFAAGAILAMLADTMMPEAYENGGFSIAILTVLGFLLAFILTKI